MDSTISKAMKVLITTMHRGHNYGSALQTYALSEVIKQQGHVVYILDYIPKRIQNSIILTTLLKKLFNKSTNKYEKYNAIRGLFIHISNEFYYNRFFNKHLKLTRKYYSIKDIEKNMPDANIYLTGSDQVWNSNHNQGIDKVFFLSFVPQNIKKIAYAASFGKQELETWEIKETQYLLQRYQAISVRESSALKILQSLEIKNGWHVLDPTLLLSKEEWIEKCPHLNIKEKYLLIYSVEPNKNQLIEYAKLIADKLKLKIYLVEWGFKRQPGTDKMIHNISPLTLMSYFIQTEYIIASSFHGTAFAVNLNKQFISVAPNHFSTRAKSLLKLINLEDRFITNKEFDLNQALSYIDYAKVNTILEQQRKISTSFLTHAIN